MTIYNTFDTFYIDDERQILGKISNSAGNALFEGPLSATFTTPPMVGGDSFDLRTALANESGLSIFVYNEDVVGLALDDSVRAAIVDLYWRDDSLSELQRVSAYPGIPPRYKLGSYTESVNGIVTGFEYLNYRAQAVGRRVVLMDRDITRPIWGVHPDEARPAYDSRLWTTPPCHVLTLDLDPAAVFDENEGADPPLPPNIVPLTVTLYGRAYFFFYGAYSYRQLLTDGSYLDLDVTVRSQTSYPGIAYGVGWAGGSGFASV